jgi:hypothetical protein
MAENGAVRDLYEQVESATAKAFEEMVAKPSFGRLLAMSAENVVALTRIGADMADLVLRNLRLAGRADITRLGRQLNRTDDKLERVLQEVEWLRDALAHDRGARLDEPIREPDDPRDEPTREPDHV